MSRKYDQIFQTIHNRVWALHPAKLEEMYSFFDWVLAGEKIEFPESAAGKSGNKAEERYEVVDGVAVLPVFGIIDKRMNLFMHISGGTSTQLLARDFRQAQADPRVKSILLDIDSPGGSVDGTKELADLIFQARDGGKPVVAYANGLMASAAYWLGSGAPDIVSPETAEIGSIGVALMHYDYSEADAQEGVKRTVITAGKYKRIASDEKPLTEEGREYLQDLVDDYYALFLEAVARNRGVDPETAHERLADGRIFVGKKALKAGLVDQIGYFDDALAVARAKGGAMPNITKAQLQEENPELFAQILEEGKVLGIKDAMDQIMASGSESGETLRAEGREQERARVVEIFEAAGGQGLMLQVFKNGTGVKDALKLMVSSHEQMKAETLKSMQTAAPPVLGTEPLNIGTHTQDNPNASLETEARDAWEKDPGLKATFGTFDRYLMVKKNEGNIKSK